MVISGTAAVRAAKAVRTMNCMSQSVISVSTKPRFTELQQYPHAECFKPAGAHFSEREEVIADDGQAAGGA